ncbi:MAG: hybrid sensor histidine kinase/response regulator [Burkholderiales bacterium]
MDINQAIRAEQARLIHRNIPTAVIGGFIVVCLTVAVFSRVVPLANISIWLAAAALLSIYRMLAWRRFRRTDFTGSAAQEWLRTAMTGAALSGILWGAGSFMLSPADLVDYQLLYVWAVVMMSVAAMFSFSAYYPCFLAFTLPWTIPVMVDVAMKGSAIHWGIAAGILMFALVAARFMWTFSQVFIESLRLGFENMELVGKLMEQKEAAEAANLAKSRFLAVASHDLRQPMHALNLYVGSLASLDLSERARALLGNVRQCGEAMDKMFRALLDVSRLDAGTVQPDMRTFSVGSLLDRIRMEFEPQARKKGLQLRIVSCRASVHSDPALVERIVRNLVVNAVAHTRRGKVLVGCRRVNDILRIAVHDTGPGISADQHSAIFQEFYQLGNPERNRSKGLGLGLAIVARLAKLLSAPVHLTSEPGRGSIFTIDLPKVHEQYEEMPAAKVATSSVHDNLSGSLIVVVDDEASILDATRTLLETWGCTVITAASGAEALKNLGASTRVPDVVMCDYRLRGDEDGIRVVEALRAEFNEDIPAMLVTGDTGPERIREIEASGLLVLHKPILEDQLRATLSRLASN